MSRQEMPSAMPADLAERLSDVPELLLSARDYELALEEVVDTIMTSGRWPRRGAADFLLEQEIEENHHAAAVHLAAAVAQGIDFRDQLDDFQAVVRKALREDKFLVALAEDYAEETWRYDHG